MDYRDTPEEAAFRKEVRAFIEAESPKNMPRGESGWGGEGQAWKDWVKKLSDRGWVAPAWPKEYGGAGMSVMEQFIFITATGHSSDIVD
jgi:alkylation response protein AidB-like acyl-CoA dehydrogenase